MNKALEQKLAQIFNKYSDYTEARQAMTEMYAAIKEASKRDGYEFKGA